MDTTTRIDVRRRTDGRLALRTRGDVVVPRRLPAAAGSARVALVASQALLLAGDHVRVEVAADGPVEVDVVEVAGTVAYDMRGGSASWEVVVSLTGGASLRWEGLPFVVADGADVVRSTCLDVRDGGAVWMRETLVLGRTGESGGDLVVRSRASLDGVPLLLEDLDLRRDHRSSPAVLGHARCLDTVTTAGQRLADGRGVLQLEGCGSVARSLVASAHLSGVAGSDLAGAG